MDLIKGVVRYADGRLIKGYTRDFFPNKASFHLEVVYGDSKGNVIELEVQELKAVFFVRDFLGTPSYDKRKYFLKGQQFTGRKVVGNFSPSFCFPLVSEHLFNPRQQLPSAHLYINKELYDGKRKNIKYQYIITL